MTRVQPIIPSCSILAIGVLLAFWPSINADFLEWDDDHNVYNNPRLQELNAENLRWMFLDVGRDTRYKALSWLGWSFLRHGFGLNPTAFHAANVILHAINSCLLFFLLLRFLAISRPAIPKSDSEDNSGTWFASLAALVWALHPYRVEPVAWVTGFPYHLSLLFLLAALYCYLGLDFGRSVYRQRKYWVTLGWYTAAMMSYPMPIGGVALFIALNVFPLSRLSLQGILSRNNQRTALELCPLLAISGAMLAVAVYGAHVRVGIFAEPPNLNDFPLTNRIAQAAYIWCYYLWKPFLPFQLSPVYLTFADFNPAAPKFLLSTVALVAAGVWVFRHRLSHPAIAAFWLAHLGVLVPVLGVNVLNHTASDRYSIIHGLLLSMTMAYCLTHLMHGERRRGSLMITTIVAILFGILSWHQCHIWKNNFTFFSYQIETLPNSGPRATALFRVGNQHFHNGKLAAAVEFFEAADRSFPGIRIPEKPFRHGEALFALGRFPEAEQQYRLALELRTDAPEVWYGLGQSLLAQGRIDEVVPLFDAALELHRDIPQFHDDLAKVHGHRGRKEKAAFHLEAARRIRATSP